MSAARLKTWMKKYGKTEVDISSMTKLSVGTVRNYLDEKPVHRSTEAALERLIQDPEDKVSGKTA